MKPKKPRNPKGYGPSVPGRRGRPIGSKPYYNPNQTSRYKSQLTRYSKAVEMAEAGPNFVQTKDYQILSNDQVYQQGVYIFELSDRIEFLYSSKGAPDDYWTVTAERSEDDGEGEEGGEGGAVFPNPGPETPPPLSPIPAGVNLQIYAYGDYANGLLPKEHKGPIGFKKLLLS